MSLVAGVHADERGTVIALLDTKADTLRITRGLTTDDDVTVMAALGTIDTLAGARIVHTDQSTVKRTACGRGNAGWEDLLTAAVRRWDVPNTRAEAVAAWLAAVAAQHLLT